jgi:hypothetical protein
MVRGTGLVAVSETLHISRPQQLRQVTSLIPPSAATVLIISTRLLVQRCAFLPRHGGGYGSGKFVSESHLLQQAGFFETLCICWRRSLADAGPPPLGVEFDLPLSRPSHSQDCSASALREDYLHSPGYVARIPPLRFQAPMTGAQVRDWLWASSFQGLLSRVC